MKKFLFIFLSIFMIFSCSNKRDYIVFNLMSEPRTLDLHKTSDAISRQISSSLYEPLLNIGKDGKIVNGIAKSYEKIGNEYIFTIKENLKYHDGTDIKIEDVKTSLIRVLTKENASQYASMLFPIKNAESYYKGNVSEDELGIKIKDDKLVIELEKDVIYFPFILTLPVAVPYNEGRYNGAYMLESKKEQEINLVKNPFYHKKNDVEIEKVKYIYFNDYTTVNNLIKNGDIDISNVDIELINDKNVNIFIDGRIWYFDFNLVNSKNSLNFHLRSALSTAINREEYVKYIKGDGSIAAYNLIRKEFNYIPEYILKEDDIFAKEQIMLAKKELGNDIEIDFLVGNTPTEIKEATYIKHELEKKLEIKINIRSLPFKDRLTEIRENKYDVALNTWSPKYDDPLAILDRFIYKSKNVRLYNHTLYKYLVEDARTNVEFKEKLTKHAEAILLQNYFVTPIYFSSENKYIASHLDNIIYNKIGGIIDISQIKKK